MRIAGVTSAKIVGSWKKPRANGPSVRRRPPVAACAPSARPISTYSMTFWSCASLIEGPICGLRVEAVAHPQRACARATNALDERRVDPLVDDHPAGGGAALPGRAEAAPQAAVDRELEVGVIHHDDEVLAAHLEMDLLEQRRAGLVDQPPGRRRSGERHHAHRRVGRQRRARSGPVAGHHVDDARAARRRRPASRRS